MYPSATLYTAYQNELSRKLNLVYASSSENERKPTKKIKYDECLFVESVVEYMSKFVEIIHQ